MKLKKKLELDKTREILFELKVKDVMSNTLTTVSPDESMNDLRRVLRESNISGVPVVDNKKLVGLISIEDLIRWLSDGGEDCLIRKRMTTNIQSLYSDQPLHQAVRFFNESKFGRYPVLDRHTKNMIGIITKGDLIEGTLKKLTIEYENEELEQIRKHRVSKFFVSIPSDHTAIRLRYNIKGKDFDKAGKASTTLKKNLKALGIRPDIIHRVAIASYEAEMNTVIYTDGGTMDYSIDTNMIFVKISDSGPGIEDIEKAMQPGYTTSPPWVKELGFGAGMGLSNIKKCSDEMKIESTVGIGTTIILHIYLGDHYNET